MFNHQSEFLFRDIDYHEIIKVSLVNVQRSYTYLSLTYRQQSWSELCL